MYLTFYKRRKRRYLKGIILIICIALPLLSAPYIAEKIHSKNASSKSAEKQEKTVEETLNPAQASREKAVSEGIMHTLYTYSCGHTEEEERSIPSSYLGKTAEEIKAEFNNIDSVSYENGILKTSVLIGSQCMNHYTARLYGSVIKIFPVSNPDATEKEIHVDLNYFYPEEIEELKYGIPLNGKDEMLEFIENFQS